MTAFQITMIVLITPISIVCLCAITLGVMGGIAIWRHR